MRLQVGGLSGLRRGIDLGIGVLDGGLQAALLVLRALAGLAVQHVARPDEGQGADDAAGLAAGALWQGDQVLCGAAGAGDDGGL